MALASHAAPRSEGELREFIAHAEESSVVEYKQAFHDGLHTNESKQEFAKDFCSFLNHGEGVLIFGVADRAPRRLTPILANEAAAGSGQVELELLKSRIVEAKKLIVDSSLSQLRLVETSVCSYEHIFSAADGGYYIVFGFRGRPAERCYVLEETEQETSEGRPYGRNTKGVQIPASDEVVHAVVTRLTLSFEFKAGGVSEHTHAMLEHLNEAKGFSYRVDKASQRHLLVKDLTFTRTQKGTTDEEVCGALIQALAPVSFELFLINDLERGAPEKLQVLDAIESIDINWQTKGLSAKSQAAPPVLFPPEVKSRYLTQQQWRHLQGCFAQDAFQAAGATVPLLNLGSVQCNNTPLDW
ncbi:MAG TPA: ATP-binding protein [Thiomonas arsenitoxydans]|uniref:ATP-binding protein n=1 Tax=Thiomonas TaxID=32012 RepID=UPI002580F05C|nr:MULTISPECIES: ATP-binding protein [Thiomonas]HML82568.1 ATP-binding protein [Thiomonas arsenitoxydans]